MSDTVLIFGARHLGRAIASHFARAGAGVALMARTKSDVEAAAAEVTALGGRGLALVGDLTSREDARRAAAETSARLGGLHLAVNAVSPGGRFGPRPFLEL